MLELSPLAVSILALIAFFMLMSQGLPIAFSFAVVGTAGIALLKNLDIALMVLGDAPFTWAANPSLLSLPLFILMGQFVFQAGISSELYDTGNKWVGRFPGGLALATTLACTGFAACSGSSAAASATIATAGYEEMRKYHYSPLLAAGCITAGGSISVLIPPSMAFILYGVITETSISKLFIGGILPGLLLSSLYLGLIYVLCKRKPELGPPGRAFSLQEKLASLKGIIGVTMLFLLVMGGLFSGICTPTEAGSIGAFGALVLAIVRRKMPWRGFVESLKTSIVATSFILTIAIGAMLFANFLAISGFSYMFAEWIKSIPLSPHLIVVCILVIYIPLGCLMDTLAMLLLTLPIVFPVIKSLGFDPIWFGVLVTLVAEMGLMTPPVGMNVFIIHGVTKVPMHDLFRGVAPFLGVMLLGLVLLFLFPQISLYLPSVMN